jgi:hypothetical protein
VLGHLEDGVDGLLLGAIDERARIDDEDVRIRRLWCHLVTSVASDAQHDLAIDKVLRATEGEKANLHC